MAKKMTQEDIDKQEAKEKVFKLGLNDKSTERLSADYVMCQCWMATNKDSRAGNSVSIQIAVRQKIIFDELAKRFEQESFIVKGIL